VSSASYSIVFAGTPEFSVPVLQALLSSPHRVVAVYTQPDRPAGRGRQLTASPVKRVALEHGLAVEQPSTLKDQAAVERLASYGADLMVVVGYGLLLPSAVLAAPRLGCINVHASLLPRWRGAAPIQRAILAGDPETGVTIMQMDAGLDTGPMLLKRTTPITREDTSATLHERLATLGAQALLDALSELERLVPQPQPEEGVTYATKIRKEEARIDWTRPAVELERMVSAFNPWPVAETTWRGQQLRIWEATATEREHSAAPGTVLQCSQDGIEVATGAGTLTLKRLQLAGRTAMSAAQFLNAHRLQDAVLGQ
jgi:methionyl-tRNA formyltransferase